MLIQRNPLLLKYNTFHLPVYAREMLTIENNDDYMAVFDHSTVPDSEYLVLGDGSNILFTTHYDGLIITTDDHRFEIEEENSRYVTVRAGAGLNWHRLVMKTIEMGYQGLENLSLIPGRVGAAPIQNIGAYGVEIEDYILSVEALDLHEKKMVEFKKNECGFSYRSSIFKTIYKDRFLIKSIRLRLNKIPRHTISYDNIQNTLERMGVNNITTKAISDAIIKIRKSKLPDPEKLGNAGSFFKNPVIDKNDFEELQAEFPGIKGYETGLNQVKIPAAWLIDHCGWKGKRFGDAGVHDQQPLVLVNYGNAGGKEILELSQRIRESVKEKFGIILDPEVNIV